MKREASSSKTSINIIFMAYYDDINFGMKKNEAIILSSFDGNHVKARPFCLKICFDSSMPICTSEKIFNGNVNKVGRWRKEKNYCPGENSGKWSVDDFHKLSSWLFFILTFLLFRLFPLGKIFKIWSFRENWMLNECNLHAIAINSFASLA